MNKDILYNSELLREETFAADEAFLTNAIQGVKWIESFEEKKYLTHKIANWVFDKLNSEIYLQS